jgi:FKBP-type peptidyl-prolyl cis-trans isomerase
MKNTYSSIIVILVIAVAVLSFMLVKDKNDEQVSGVINQVTQQTTTMATEQTAQSIPGLDIKVVQPGTGAVAENGKTVFVHYTGRVQNGEVFDSSIPRGEPIDFQLGAGIVIQGWEKGILGMKVGEKRVLTIAPELGYGSREVTSPANGKVLIPANSVLVFDVELVDVK